MQSGAFSLEQAFALAPNATGKVPGYYSSKEALSISQKSGCPFLADPLFRRPSLHGLHSLRVKTATSGHCLKGRPFCTSGLRPRPKGLGPLLLDSPLSLNMLLNRLKCRLRPPLRRQQLNRARCVVCREKL